MVSRSSTRPASGSSSAGGGTPPAQQGNLATRVLRRLRSLPLFNRRPTPPQWRSVRDRTPTPHPFDGSGGLSIATASSDGQIVGPGIWTPIAAPGAAGTASTSAGAGSGSGSGARRGSGLTTSAFTTPLSNPSPRQLALEPDADDLERLRIALESQRQRAEEEEEGEGVADADADLEGDTVLDMDEIPPLELDEDGEFDGATLVSGGADSTERLLLPPSDEDGDEEGAAGPSSGSRGRTPSRQWTRVLRRVRRGLW